MKLGFYYHIPAYKKEDGKIYLPGFLGVFIDSMAKEVNHLYCFMHQPQQPELNEEDYVIKSTNVTLVELGSKTPAYIRMLFPSRYKKVFQKYGKFCDNIIVRSPSPLAPFIYTFLKNETNVVYLIVGDYTNGIKYLNLPPFRKLGIRWFLMYYQYLQNKVISKCKVLVNSQQLFDENKNIAKEIHQIRTTSLSMQNFYYQEDRCQSSPFQLLYSGRLDFAKGLMEIVEALRILAEEGIDVIFNLVGWEEGGKESVKKSLLDKARKLGVESKLIFHGKKPLGLELYAIYQKADIFVIPSYHEGFPRVIWEAMANSLPVIATAVGSIPFFLKHEENSILIQPKSPEEIFEAVYKIIQDVDLRKKLIKNGLSLAKMNTLEKQTKFLIDKL